MKPTLLLAFLFASCGIAAEKTFYTPEQDKAGLHAGSETSDDLPKVLLIGDSISIGYTKAVVRHLKGEAEVRRAKANCGDTPRGLRDLDKWLGDTRWDIIHFNWGLWDLCYRHPDSKDYGNRDKVNGTQAVPLPEYEKNLEQLVQRLKKTGATLIWASTTVVPEGEAGRIEGDELKYNAVARGVMQRHGVTINDLHAVSAALPPDRFTAPGDVHFTKAGYGVLAEVVAEVIRQALPAAEATGR